MEVIIQFKRNVAAAGSVSKVWTTLIKHATRHPLPDGFTFITSIRRACLARHSCKIIHENKPGFNARDEFQYTDGVRPKFAMHQEKDQ